MGRFSIWDAVERAVCAVKETEGTEIPVLDSLGCILAEDIYTKIAQPPFPRSAMDGYAIHAADSQHADPEHPAELKVVGCQYAGDPYFRKLEAGEALRIMTGAAIPEGADAVIRQEDTDYGDDLVRIYYPVAAMDNYCVIGEDFPKGDCLAVKGDRVDAYMIAAAVAAGLDRLPVRRPVRAGVITTGDELQEPGKPLAEGKIYNSNLALFATRLKSLGCKVEIALSAGDSSEAIMEVLRKAKESCDLVVTTGGVSVGLKDLIPEVMEELGADVIFHGISIKPGMPTMFSMYGDLPVLSLSGNPYSAAAVFELLAQPILRKMSGSSEPVLKKVSGIAQDSFPKKTGCMRFLRGYYEEGKLFFKKGQRNGQTKAGIGTNCLICLEAGRPPVEPGERLTAYLI